MKLDKDTKLKGRWNEDWTDPWEKYAVASDTNRTISLDAYGVYIVEAITDDIYVMECDSASDAASASVDGYGQLIREGSLPQVMVAQYSYDGSNSYIGAIADTTAATLRVKKIGRQAP